VAVTLAETHVEQHALAGEREAPGLKGSISPIRGLRHR
jgi:hypothetical protein